jgi:hypothetical protein
MHLSFHDGPGRGIDTQQKGPAAEMELNMMYRRHSHSHEIYSFKAGSTSNANSDHSQAFSDARQKNPEKCVMCTRWSQDAQCQSHA